MNSLTEYLYALPFWEKLTEKEQGLIQDNAYIRFFDRNAPIHSETIEDIGFVMILDGRIRAFVRSDDGREMPLFILGNQELCVFSADNIFEQNSFQLCLTADCISKVLVVNMSIAQRLMNENLYLRCFVYELLAGYFASAMESVKWICFHGLEQRIAAFLISEYDRCGEMRIRLTHDYIAHHVGTSRERVTKTLKQLCEKGLIAKANRCIEIIDIKGLREAAENSSMELPYDTRKGKDV